MYWFKRVGMFAVMFALALVMSSKAEAALLTINDGADVWTLDVQTGCTSCAVQLKVVYGASPAHPGTLLDLIQFDINNSNYTPSVTNPVFIGTSGSTVTNTAANWTFSQNSLNNNACSGGNVNATCGNYIGNGLAITANSTLVWNFTATFTSAVTGALGDGNIRASYNNANGSNAGIFSPGGGTFTSTSTNTSTNTSTSTNVPEPSALLLLGVGLIALRRVIKR